MRGKIKILILFSGILFLQSCYTMLNPPQTLPQTYNTVTTQVVGGSSIGGSVYSGWDPYWEPVLPYTDYYGGYGATYYSPYNYYDYHHPYYAPVYIQSDQATPVIGRTYGREDKQGSDRLRDSKSSTNSQPIGIGAGGVSTAAPAASTPVVIKPNAPDNKNPALRNARPSRDTKRVNKRVQKPNPQPVKQEEPEKTEQADENQRTRTKK